MSKKVKCICPVCQELVAIIWKDDDHPNVMPFLCEKHQALSEHNQHEQDRHEREKYEQRQRKRESIIKKLEQETRKKICQEWPCLKWDKDDNLHYYFLVNGKCPRCQLRKKSYQFNTNQQKLEKLSQEKEKLLSEWQKLEEQEQVDNLALKAEMETMQAEIGKLNAENQRINRQNRVFLIAEEEILKGETVDIDKLNIDQSGKEYLRSLQQNHYELLQENNLSLINPQIQSPDEKAVLDKKGLICLFF